MADFLPTYPAERFPRTVELFLPPFDLRNCLKVDMLILSVVPELLFLPAGVGREAFFPPVVDFLPLVGAVAAAGVDFLGANLRIFSTVLPVVAAFAPAFLADLLAAFAALFPEAPPLTFGAAAVAGAAFLPDPPRVATLVVPSLKCQSSFPATMLSVPPATWPAREAWTDLWRKC